MFDTHCHLTFPEFRDRLGDVLDEAELAGVRGAITVATGSDNSVAALALAESDPRVWCTSGVHPLHSDEPIDWDAIRHVGSHPRCVAWGEMGLDNHYEHPGRAVQHRVLEAQLARVEGCRSDGLDLPIVIHCREAFDDLIPILRTTSLPSDRMVFHCFTGTPEDARAVLDFGAWISFTGVVTFSSARAVAEAARLVPADRIMAETDAPFLSPEPVRTKRPNVPACVAHVIRRLAHLRDEPLEQLDAQLDSNAERFFGIRIGAPSVDSR